MNDNTPTHHIYSPGRIECINRVRNKSHRPSKLSKRSQCTLATKVGELHNQEGCSDGGFVGGGGRGVMGIGDKAKQEGGWKGREGVRGRKGMGVVGR